MGELADKLAADGKQRKPLDADAWCTLLGRMLGNVDRFDVDVVKWPGRDDIVVGIRLLSDFELAEAETSARAWARGKAIESGKDRYDDREFVAQYGAELLCRALVNHESKQRLVDTPAQLRQMVTRDEMEFLALRLRDHQESFAPDLYTLTEDEIHALAEAVKRPDPFRERALATSGPSTLRRLVRCLVGQLAKCPPSQSSPTTEPTGSTSES